MSNNYMQINNTFIHIRTKNIDMINMTDEIFIHNALSFTNFFSYDSSPTKNLHSKMNNDLTPRMLSSTVCLTKRRTPLSKLWKRKKKKYIKTQIQIIKLKNS